ncbi:AAA family ATPase [Pedobacter sp.]|uniref:AAA family ATPase n=1 Tax=Pedobacter sp. TaxID=1411316 RepID=UPI00396CE35A
MKIYNNHFHVISGGPGAGKTTLLNELERRGYLVVPEEARRIIKEEIARKGQGLPWENKAAYAALMLAASVTTYKRLDEQQIQSSVFFDRAILDTFCYLNMENLELGKEAEMLAAKYRYNQKVFLLPPWPEIYETDRERKQIYAEAAHTFKLMKTTYEQYGYETIEVPKDTVENRADFVLKIVNSLK